MLAAYTAQHVAAMRMSAGFAALATERVLVADQHVPAETAVRDEMRSIIARGAFATVFQQIVELGFVKLDRAIIAGLDADPARQAFVAGCVTRRIAGPGYRLGRPQAAA